VFGEMRQVDVGGQVIRRSARFCSAALELAYVSEDFSSRPSGNVRRQDETPREERVKEV
jgi:hypothetical protein